VCCGAHAVLARGAEIGGNCITGPRIDRQGRLSTKLSCPSNESSLAGAARDMDPQSERQRGSRGARDCFP
jgi:hypothetical protein